MITADPICLAATLRLYYYLNVHIVNNSMKNPLQGKYNPQQSIHLMLNHNSIISSSILVKSVSIFIVYCLYWLY